MPTSATWPSSRFVNFSTTRPENPITISDAGFWKTTSKPYCPKRRDPKAHPSEHRSWKNALFNCAWPPTRTCTKLHGSPFILICKHFSNEASLPPMPGGSFSFLILWNWVFTKLCQHFLCNYLHSVFFPQIDIMANRGNLSINLEFSTLKICKLKNLWRPAW